LVAASLERGTLIELLPDEPGRLEDSHLIWPQAPHLPIRVRVAIDALAEGLANAETCNRSPQGAVTFNLPQVGRVSPLQ
jgi:DNA-binding transcriptional LysR family regulator